MVQVFRTLCCFSSKPFLKQLLHLMFPPYPSAENLRYEVFSHPSWVLKHFFLEGFKVFLHSVNEIQVIALKKVEKYDGKNIFLYCIVSISLEINYDSI